MNLEQILGIKGMKTLEQALSSFCRRFSFSPKEGWEILENHDGELETFILQAQANDPQVSSEVRGEVNKWWKEFHKDFANLGLGRFRNVSKASKAEASYELLICLCFLTEKLREKQRLIVAERQKVLKVVPKPKLTLRQKVAGWIKRFLKMVGKNV